MDIDARIAQLEAAKRIADAMIGLLRSLKEAPFTAQATDFSGFDLNYLRELAANRKEKH